jgi:hypothetical protein
MNFFPGRCGTTVFLTIFQIVNVQNGETFVVSAPQTGTADQGGQVSDWFQKLALKLLARKTLLKPAPLSQLMQSAVGCKVPTSTVQVPCEVRFEDAGQMILLAIFMKNKLSSILLVFLVLCCGSTVVQAQFTFDRPKTEPPLPNPYTIGVLREPILGAAREVLKACAIPLDEELSRANEGKLVTKPVVFSRGVTVRNDLEYFAELPASNVRNWSQARYALEIVALPLDQKRSQLQVNAIIQGRVAETDGTLKWVDGRSNGRLEDEFIRGLAGKILGVDLSLKGKNQRRLLNCEY